MNRTIHLAVLTLLATSLALGGCGRNDFNRFMTSAEAKMAQGDYRAAVIELKNALAQSPNDARARFMLGSALLKSGDPAAATTELNKALALKVEPDVVYPQIARALVLQGAPRRDIEALLEAPLTSATAKAEVAANIGIAYIGLEMPKEAREQIERAVAADPANLTARIAQAQLAAVDGDLSRARTIIEQAVASAPTNTDALMLRGDIAVAAGERQEAIAAYEAAVANSVQSLRPRFALVSAYVRENDVDKAAAHLSELAKIAPADPRTHYATALVAFVRGDTPAALAAIEKTMQVAPDYLPARYLSGLIDLKRGSYAAAENSLRTVVSRSPSDDSARLALAQAYLRRDQAAKAQEVLEPALRRSPENAKLLSVAADVQLALKRPDRAAELLTRANALPGSDVNGRVRLAQIKLAKGELQQGIQDLESLAGKDSATGEPDLALVTALLRSGDYAKALAAADALVRKQPTSAAAQNVRATVLVAKGDLKGARTAYEKALALDPGFTTGTLNLAKLDAMEHKPADARKKFEQVIAKDPKSEAALLGLAQLLVASKAPEGEVLAAVRAAVDANPASVAARLALINYYARQKDWKSAVTVAQQAQAAIPDTPAILDALGSVQHASGDLNQALETFMRLSRYQPSNPLPLLRAAVIQAQLKNADSAIALLRSAFVIDSANASIAMALAAGYMNASLPDQGLAEAKRMQKERADKAMGYILEGEIYAAQKRLPEAIASYRTALAKESLPMVVVRLHTLLAASGKGDEAGAIAQKWLKDHPKDVQVRAALGQASLAKGDVKTALPFLRAAHENDPNNVVVLNNLAWTLGELNDPKALELAARAYVLAPNVPEVANTYGWILVQRGQTAQGIDLLRRAVELAPNDAEKRLRLARGLIKGGDKPGARAQLETVVAKTDVSPAARSQAEQLLKDL